MSNKFFFITTYDHISGEIIESVLNTHPDIHCSISQYDPFITKPLPYKINVDEFIESNTNSTKLFNGNVQLFSAHELLNKILLEKTKAPLRKINLSLDPKKRIDFLLYTWIQVYKSADIALEKILDKIIELKISNHYLITKFNLNYYLEQVRDQAAKEAPMLTNSYQQLFLIALAYVITLDSADLPTAGNSVNLKNLIDHEDSFYEFLNYITCNKLELTNEQKSIFNASLVKAKSLYETPAVTKWEAWQTILVEKFLLLRLQTIYHPHIDSPLAYFYHEASVELELQAKQDTNNYSKLLSIQLNSNRPSQLSIYFDNIEETIDDPSLVEVLVNIDDNDIAMEEMLRLEIPQRTFTIKYVKTPRPKSFCDLWQPINKLLEITDPNAYFLLNISDEMLFATKGWDTILKKYVGFFPDHIFRLRGSRNKFRNYFDRWECSFGQDSIPITTKKWIDIGGDWNPCFGPDSFQQLISFYLAKEGLFSSTNFLRELPIIDIKFHGDIPALGLDASKAWKHNRDHIAAMQICQSYKMQLEARRRAVMIKAHIIAHAKQFKKFNILDNKHKKQITLINLETNESSNLDYNLNRLSIWIVNQTRKLRFYSYFGAGKEYPRKHILGFLGYLKAKYYPVNMLYLILVQTQKQLNLNIYRIKKYIKHVLVLLNLKDKYEVK